MIGQPLSRVDGPLKVTGRATYAYEEWGVGQPLYGFIVGATIGRGRIAGIDTSRAERAPGVRRVLTHRDAPAQGTPDLSIVSMYSRALPVLADREIRYFGQPVALVVADTFEQARAAAALVEVSYDVARRRTSISSRARTTPTRPKQVNAGLATDTAVGDFDAAFAGAPVQIDQTVHDAIHVLSTAGAAQLPRVVGRRRRHHPRQHADRRGRHDIGLPRRSDSSRARSGSSRATSAADSAPSSAFTRRRFSP